MKTVKDRIFKNSYTAYLRALMASPVGAKRGGGYTAEILINTFSFMALLYIVMMNETELFYGNASIEIYVSAIFGAILYANWLILGVSRRAKPSPLGLAPISWKKRCMYSYLTNFLYAVFEIVMLTVFAIVWMFIAAIIVLFITGEWVFVITEIEQITSVPACWQGQVFSAFAGLLFYGAGACISYVNSKKLRITLSIVFPILMGIFARILIGLAYGTDEIILMRNLPAMFDQIPSCIVWLVLTIVAALGTVGLSIFLCIRNEKPSKI